MKSIKSDIILKIPSKLLYLGVPDAVIMEMAGDLPFSKSDMEMLSTAVIEACTNSMEHGNAMNEDLIVEVHFCFLDDSVRITVLDNGSGFDHEAWIPTEDPMAQRGRGVKIMREFTDELIYDFADDGRFRLTLIKKMELK
jgi:serine/threonine-protein kinase RsbW